MVVLAFFVGLALYVTLDPPGGSRVGIALPVFALAFLLRTPRAADVVGGDLFGVLLRLLARGGRYATAGAIGGPTTRIDLRDLICMDLELYGITNPTADTFARVVHLIEDGRIKPILERAYPLRELAIAQEPMKVRAHTSAGTSSRSDPGLRIRWTRRPVFARRAQAAPWWSLSPRPPQQDSHLRRVGTFAPGT